MGRLASSGVIALVAAAWTLTATADDTALRQEVSALKQMVLDLQARVLQLEGRTPAAAQAAPELPPTTPAIVQPSASVPQVVMPVAPAAQSVPVPAAAPVVAATRVDAASGYVSAEAALRANWAKVAKEMDQAEVIALLGEPSGKSNLDGRTVWYYLYPGTGRGSVFFTDNGRVSSRQSPFGMGW